MTAYRAMADQPLIALIQAGNHEAFAELVTRHTDRFFNLAFRTLQNQGDAEDVVQTAFIKFWERPQQWNAELAKFTTWFYRVVLNACNDMLRRSGRSIEFDSEALEFMQEPVRSEQCDLEQRQLLTLRQQVLESGIRQLSASQRDALNLVVYCELPQRQAAQVMGVSVKAVESLLIRAKRNLKHYVDTNCAAANRNEVDYAS